MSRRLDVSGVKYTVSSDVLPGLGLLAKSDSEQSDVSSRTIISREGDDACGDFGVKGEGAASFDGESIVALLPEVVGT